MYVLLYKHSLTPSQRVHKQTIGLTTQIYLHLSLLVRDWFVFECIYVCTLNLHNLCHNNVRQSREHFETIYHSSASITRYCDVIHIFFHSPVWRIFSIKCVTGLIMTIDNVFIKNKTLCFISMFLVFHTQYLKQLKKYV